MERRAAESADSKTEVARSFAVWLDDRLPKRDQRGQLTHWSFGTVQKWSIGSNGPEDHAVALAAADFFDDEELRRCCFPWDLEVPDSSEALGPGDDGAEAPEAAQDQGAARSAWAGRPVRTLAIAAAIGVLLIMAVFAVMALLGSRHDQATSNTTTQPTGTTPPADVCDGTVGRIDPSLMSRPESGEWTTALRAAFSDAGGASVVGCVTGAAHLNGKLVIQDLSISDHPAGELIVAADSPVKGWWFNQSMWNSYTQIGGAGGLNYQSGAGLPEAITTLPDHHVEVTLSGGVVMVAERVDAPYFWLIPAYLSWWQQHQSELGLPTSNPMPLPGGNSGRQDFQHGYATVDLKSDPVAHPVTDPATDLPPRETLPNHILRQADKTSWWITSDGQRMWIPDGDVWSCHGGDGAMLGNDIAGYAVGTLPYAGVATC